MTREQLDRLREQLDREALAARPAAGEIPPVRERIRRWIERPARPAAGEWPAPVRGRNLRRWMERPGRPRP